MLEQRTLEMAHYENEGLDAGFDWLHAARPLEAGPRLFLAQKAVDGCVSIFRFSLQG